MKGLSVIVPAHNNEAVITRTLESIETALAYLRRSVRGASAELAAEVVVVDDGSVDSTFRAVQEFASSKDNYKLIRRVTSSNAACARNVGVAASSGDILFFLDGDDLFLEPHLAVCCQMLVEDKSLMYVKTGVKLADPVHPEWKGRITNSLVINMCVRRECHDRVGGFPDFHVFGRGDDRFVHAIDVFRGIEDVYYNRAVVRSHAGIRIEDETVEYVRYPGNSYDRQYQQFQFETDRGRWIVAEDEQARIAVAEAIIRWTHGPI